MHLSVIAALIAVSLLAPVCRGQSEPPIPNSEMALVEEDPQERDARTREFFLGTLERNTKFREAPWYEAARSLLEECIPWYQDSRHPIDARDLEERLDLLIGREGCDAPQVLFATAIAKSRRFTARSYSARRLFEQVIQSEGAPFRMRAYAADWVISGLEEHEPRTPGARQQKERDRLQMLRYAHDHIASAVLAGEFPPDRIEDAARIIIGYMGRDVPTSITSTTVQRLREGGADSWLVNTITGLYHVRAAWEARGAGWASEVTRDGWEGFNQHLAEARTFLMRAHELHPERPHAAGHMITVAMGGGGRDGRDERYWFDEAVKARFDYAPAYDSYLWAIRPRWGGSHQRMLEFGRRCAETGRHDTDVPKYFVEAIHDICDERDSYDILHDPDVYETARTVLLGCADHESDEGEHRKLLSTLSAFAVYTERWADAYSALARLNFFARTDRFTLLGLDAQDAANRIMYNVSPGRDSILTGLRFYDQQQFQEAIPHFEEALPLAEGYEYVQKMIRRNIQRSNIAVAFLAGEKVILPIEEDLNAWKRIGEWVRTPEGGAQLVDFTNTERDALCTYTLGFGHRLEITGEIVMNHEPPPRSPGRVRAYVGGYAVSLLNDDSASVFSGIQLDWHWFRGRLRTYARLTNGYHHFDLDSAQVASGVNTFRLSMWDEYIVVEINDAVVYTGLRQPVRAKHPGRSVGVFHVRSNDHTATPEYRSIAVRVLSEMPEELK